MHVDVVFVFGVPDRNSVPGRDSIYKVSTVDTGHKMRRCLALEDATGKISSPFSVRLGDATEDALRCIHAKILTQRSHGEMCVGRLLISRLCYAYEANMLDRIKNSIAPEIKISTTTNCFSFTRKQC
jgi:hypothetical protein